MAGKGFGNTNDSSKKKKASTTEESQRPVTLDTISNDDDDHTAPTEYPAMNRKEISKWLSHIPVYAVTDAKGNAKAIQLGDKAVVYFFMSSIVAEAYKKKLEESSKEEEEEDFASVTVSGLFLGSIWYDFLDQDSESNEVGNCSWKKGAVCFKNF